jgi:hypothetical protein
MIKLYRTRCLVSIEDYRGQLWKGKEKKNSKIIFKGKSVKLFIIIKLCKHLTIVKRSCLPYYYQTGTIYNPSFSS